MDVVMTDDWSGGGGGGRGYGCSDAGESGGWGDVISASILKSNETLYTIGQLKL